MIQCPNCFSWVNDSTVICDCCSAAVLPPRETPPPRVADNRPPIPAFGLSVSSLILGIVAMYFAGNMGLMLATMPLYKMTVLAQGFSAEDLLPLLPTLILYAVFVAVPAVILGAIALANGKRAVSEGNRTRMAVLGKRLGLIALIGGEVAILTIIALALFLL